MNILDECRALGDEELERSLKFLIDRERHGSAKLLAHLAEYDRRQLCARGGHASLYRYCIEVLRCDEGEAFRRVRAARVIRRWPEVLELIESGDVRLTALVVLHPVLTDANRKELFSSASGKTRRELEVLVARRFPDLPRPDFMLPMNGRADAAYCAPPDAREVLPAGAAPPALRPRPSEWQAIAPVGMDRVRIGFDADASVTTLILRARQVLRHKYPEGRLEDVLREALEVLLERRDPQKRLELRCAKAGGAAPPPKPRMPRLGRYIPARVKRAVWERDEGRCAWRHPDGTPCGSRDWLEFDHVKPFARGGRSDSPRNIRLLCRLHNRMAAEAVGLSVRGAAGRSCGASSGPAAGSPACSAGPGIPGAPAPSG